MQKHCMHKYCVNPFLLAASVVLLGSLAPAQSSGEGVANVGLLGVVTASGVDDLEVLHILRSTPADKVGLQVGDRLRRVAGKRVRTPQDLDATLNEIEPGEKIAVEWTRGKQQLQGNIPLLHRRFYRDEFLQPKRTGQVGFLAPEWYAYAWQQSNDAPLPTHSNTAGKVVIIHAFQSW